MKPELGRFGAWGRVGEVTPGLAAEVEQLGYGAIWLGGSPGGELSEVAAILEATERIPVATGIVNMWRDDAGSLARTYHRLDERYHGRFYLGVGIGHRESTREYHHPYQTMVSYLGRLDAGGVPRDRLILAALGPRALRLAADRTAGAHPYLTTPLHTAGARRQVGAGVLLAPEQTVVFETDPATARDIGRRFVARYMRLSNYVNNLRREGWSDDELSDGGSDRLIDALALHGEGEVIAAGVQAHISAGADHVAVQILGHDAREGYRRLSGLLT